MKIIDVDKWGRKEAYKYFSTFSNPCYGFDVVMDITKLYNITKQRKDSFFINMLYAVILGLDSSEEMRTRIVNGNVVVYDKINPTYTVMTKTGDFENGKHLYTHNYNEFYKRCHEEVERCKVEDSIKEGYNDSKLYDDYYITCIPWLNYESMTHPLPNNDPSNSSVPRVCWGKYYFENDKVKIKLNITVSHALVDGYALSKVFNKIQEFLNNFDNIIKEEN